jgi:hypothetical protein
VTFYIEIIVKLQYYIRLMLTFTCLLKNIDAVFSCNLTLANAHLPVKSIQHSYSILNNFPVDCIEHVYIFDTGIRRASSG